MTVETRNKTLAITHNGQQRLPTSVPQHKHTQKCSDIFKMCQTIHQHYPIMNKVSHSICICLTELAQIYVVHASLPRNSYIHNEI